jgi:toxin YoeB
LNAAFTPRALEELAYWVKTDPRMARKVFELIEATRRDPYGGIGKPELLRHELSERWSRRINEEHRLVYRVITLNGENALEIVSCRFHYARR